MAGKGKGRKGKKAAPTPTAAPKLPPRADLGIGNLASAKRGTRGSDSRPRRTK